MMAQWQIDILMDLEDLEAIQMDAHISDAALLSHQIETMELVNRGERQIISYPEYRTYFMVVPINDWTAEAHFMSARNIGPWKMSKAFSKFVRDVWQQTGYQRVHALVRNPTIGRILARNGAVCEGTLRKSWLKDGGSINSHLIDQWIYSIIRDDFK